MSPPSPAARDGGETGKADRPQYFSLPVENREVFLVVSPDGSNVGTYDPTTGKSRPLKLPCIPGTRRELRTAGREPMFERQITPSRNAISASRGPWFIALDFDADQNVTRIAALNVPENTWIGQDIDEPVGRPSIPTDSGYMYTIGHRVYGFSPTSKRWGVLEFPTGVAPVTRSRNGQFWAERDGRLFVFNVRTGTWDDIYARAFEDGPSGEPDIVTTPTGGSRGSVSGPDRP